MEKKNGSISRRMFLGSPIKFICHILSIYPLDSAEVLASREFSHPKIRNEDEVSASFPNFTPLFRDYVGNFGGVTISFWWLSTPFYWLKPPPGLHCSGCHRFQWFSRGNSESWMENSNAFLTTVCVRCLRLLDFQNWKPKVVPSGKLA